MMRLRNLRSIRKSQGLSQQDLADKARVDRGTISRLENFRQSPSLETATTLADALGVSLDELVGGEK